MLTKLLNKSLKICHNNNIIFTGFVDNNELYKYDIVNILSSMNVESLSSFFKDNKIFLIENNHIKTFYSIIKMVGNAYESYEYQLSK